MLSLQSVKQKALLFGLELLFIRIKRNNEEIPFFKGMTNQRNKKRDPLVWACYEKESYSWVVWRSRF